MRKISRKLLVKRVSQVLQNGERLRYRSDPWTEEEQKRFAAGQHVPLIQAWYVEKNDRPHERIGDLHEVEKWGRKLGVVSDFEVVDHETNRQKEDRRIENRTKLMKEDQP
jgi:hypothetical protein